MYCKKRLFSISKNIISVSLGSKNPDYHNITEKPLTWFEIVSKMISLLSPVYDNHISLEKDMSSK